MDVMRDVLDQRTRDLLSGFEKARVVFDEGDRTTKVCALCLMASISSIVPAGDMRDSCEEGLQECMATMELTPEDLATIRHFGSRGP